MTEDRLGTASTAALRQYLRAAQDYGIEAEDALIKNELPLGILDNSIARVTGTEFQRLIRWLVDACNDPLFGLKSGAYVQPGSYSIFGYMIMNCRSAREALHMTPMYESIVGDMGVTKLEKAGKRLAVRWICQYDDPVIIPHMIDNVLYSWTQFARYLADLPEGKPYCVQLERSEPSKQALNVYQDMFGCDIEFNAKRNALIVDEEVLEIPLRQPDPGLLQSLTQQAESIMDELKQKNTITLQVRGVLRRLMEHELPRKEKVAEALEMTERTLQRRLREAGTGYQQVLDDIRRETAIEWLTTTQVAITDIASNLGFAEVRSFQRRFKSWTGHAPGEYRTLHAKS
ncbi:MAG TPA: AraC family transcriptional regulator [Oceanospirillales bacterium]|jgi:AraC-like DNA-binding protein|nr:AraC family transcriptional regulator [Oleispira sp.]HCM05021.1 AraC family transcriptional regulator [Oceanospirillales bacterium]|tara:strand:+ start:4992 stop:6023 length:1032 start_codon:yes stop_codon:yes gene_type:complete